MPEPQKKPGPWFWALIVAVLIGIAAMGRGSPDPGDVTTDTSDPCELPSTYEVQSDPNVAPADAYYQRCMDAVRDSFNE